MDEVDRQGLSIEHKTLLEFLKNNSRPSGIHVTPNVILKLYGTIIKIGHFSNVFVPNLGTGAICEMLNDMTVNFSTTAESNLEQRIVNRYEYPVFDRDENNSPDLVLADAPFWFAKNLDKVKALMNDVNRILSDDGLFAMTTTHNFVFSEKIKQMISEMNKEGLFLCAVIDLPDGTYLPYAGVPCKAVIFSKKETDCVFFARINTEKVIDSIVENFLKRKNGKPEELGIWEDNNTYSEFSDYISYKKILRIANSYDGEYTKLEKVILSINRPNKENVFTDHNNCIYVPKVGVSAVKTNLDDLDIKPQNYIQVALNEEIVLASYAAFFYNTESGKEIRKESMIGGMIIK